MMQNTICHSPRTQQPKQGMLAYWSLFANVSNDRTSEIRYRVREGWDG